MTRNARGISGNQSSFLRRKQSSAIRAAEATASSIHSAGWVSSPVWGRENTDSTAESEVALSPASSVTTQRRVSPLCASVTLESW